MNFQNEEESFKVVLVGEAGLGKTSLTKRFMNEAFRSDESSTAS